MTNICHSTSYVQNKKKSVFENVSFQNIVPNDAEASKRAVQAVAEDVTGR